MDSTQSVWNSYFGRLLVLVLLLNFGLDCRCYRLLYWNFKVFWRYKFDVHSVVFANSTRTGESRWALARISFPLSTIHMFHHWFQVYCAFFGWLFYKIVEFFVLVAGVTMYCYLVSDILGSNDKLLTRSIRKFRCYVYSVALMSHCWNVHCCFDCEIRQ